MTGRQWILSGLIVWHVSAVLLRAIPDPGALPPFVPVQRTDGWRGAVTALVDSAAAAWAPVPQAVGSLLRPLRKPFDFYTTLTAQGQSWAMFSNPPVVDEYLRVRYYVLPSSGRLWMATQLVWPAHPEYRVRLLQSFRDSYLDKIFSVASSEFYAHRKRDLIRPDTRPQELPDDLAPIARYYSRVFAKQLRNRGDRVVRTEVWVGTAPNAPPGHRLPEAVLHARRVLLEEYYDGIVEQRFNVPPYPPYHGVEQETDIKWLLEYYEES
jgi:hypothetical protein